MSTAIARRQAKLAQKYRGLLPQHCAFEHAAMLAGGLHPA
jgi:hypothetical protein